MVIERVHRVSMVRENSEKNIIFSRPGNCREFYIKSGKFRFDEVFF